MKKIKLTMVALMLTAGALAGCDKEAPKPDPEPEHVHTFSAEWANDGTNHWHAATCGHDVKDGEAVHTFGNDGKCSVCDYYDGGHDDARVFTDEKLGAFKGVFYSGDSVITITKDGVVVLDGDETINLQNDTIKGSGYSTVATYKGPQDTLFTLKWKRAAWDGNNLNLMLPTFVFGENELQLQPAIDKAQGWYDGWDGYMDDGVQIYIVSNDYNVEKDAFQMYTANFSYDYIGLGIYLRSSFVKIGNNFELALSWFDEEDMEAGFNYSDWNYYLVKGEDGSLIMADIDPEEVVAEWWSRPSFFMGEFIRPSSKELPLGTIFGDWSYESYTFWADEDAKTVSVNYGDELEYVEGYDEYGAYVLVDGAKYRGTSYGISIETAEGVEECPVFFFTDFYCLLDHSYISGNNSIAFALDTNWDTWETEGYLEIDGAKADKSYLTFIDNAVAIGADVGEDKYFITPFDGTDAILVGKNNDLSIYVDSGKICDFSNTYLTATFASVVCSVDDGALSVKYNGETYQASLAYDLELGTIIVTFGDDGKLVPLEADKGIYAILLGESGDFIYDESMVMSALGQWTSGKLNVNFKNDMTVQFGDNSYNMLYLTYLVDSMGSMMPACAFGNADVTFYGLVDSVNTQIYQKTELGLDYVASFVRPEVFVNFYGEFNYAGEYGTEKVSLAKDGTLIVTTMNEEKTGIVDLEYDYDAFAYEDNYGDLKAGLEFNSNDFPLDIYFDGEGHCSIFDISYLAKVFFDNQGLFGSSKDNYLSIVDNKVIYNGNKLAITSFDANSIHGTIDSDNVAIAFSGSEASVTVGEAEPVVLTKNAATVASFACEAKENVGNLGEDIKVTEDGKILAHNINDPEGVWNEITDYQFGIDEAGNAFIKASYKVAYTYTISIVEGDVVITGESSLPPLPPPPPPLPF